MKYGAVRQAILMAISKDIPQIIVHNDSQVVVNSINRKIGIPKDVINLVEDIKCLLTHFKDNKLEYCSRTVNTDADALAKMTHMCTSLFCFE